MSAGHTRLLIDAGLSRRETLKRLTAIGERAEDLNAILITHEHSDHVCGLPALARALRVPVYMTHLTAPTIAWGEYQPDVRTFQAGTGFTLGDVQVCSFTIPHDSIDPVGFCLEAEGVKIGIATDMGYMPDSVPVHLRGTHALLLESNHDLEMLRVGPYPWSIKQRVMGRRGHLSNDTAAAFVRESLDATTTLLLLGHLSEHNNHPALAQGAASQALAERGLSMRLVVAEPRCQSEVFCF